jgi:hypothetical protein
LNLCQHAPSSHHLWCDHSIFDEEYKVWSSMLCNFSGLTSVLTGAKFSPQHAALKHAQYMVYIFALWVRPINLNTYKTTDKFNFTYVFKYQTGR